MYIKEVILDGFKSYPNRTVISGFDKSFNAITGLNGSGKSNILDSICFVLGISNLSQVRVGALQELVYKQGQAGVTKASVTIIFDNGDRENSPVGYEQHSEISVTRQVVIGGKNKYMINGHTVQQAQVQNLFHSVQLNVNNPHFLIMQGRITKVLNMKPPEILGMIEEAAGTRMFETKKQAALRTMEKKQAKNDEIDRVLREEITPTLEKLRGEKSNYLAWSANTTKIERLERFCVAYEYSKALRTMQQGNGELEAMQADVNTQAERAMELAAEIKAKEAEEEELATQKGASMDKSFKKAKSAEEAVSKELVKRTTVWKNKLDELKKEQKDLAAAREAITTGAKALEDKEASLAAATAEVEQSLGALEEAKADLKKAEDDYNAMCAGVATGDDEAGEESKTLSDQITGAYEAASQADARVKQCQMKVKHLTEATKGLKKDLAAAGKEVSSLKKEHDTASKGLERLQGKLEGLGFDKEEQDRLTAEKGDLEQEIGELRPVVERLSAEVEGRLNFEFRSPSKGFDRSKVKGLVARLVTVNDPKSATALEVVAGGKLFQVVVDDERTGSAILKHGQLRKRVTIIPLNKISRAGVIDDNKAAAASQAAARVGGTAVRALELVGFDEEVRAAMEYTFGDKFVCENLEVARATAHDPRVGRKCVTLDGDVVDPQGVMTGGSSGNIGVVLKRLQQLSEAQMRLAVCEERLRGTVKTLASLDKRNRQYEAVAGEVELKEKEVELLAERLSHTSHAALETRLRESETELEEARGAIDEAKQTGKDARKRAKDLESQEAMLKAKREDRLKHMEKEVKSCKANVKAVEKKHKAVEKKEKMIRMELESLVEEAGSAETTVKALEDEIEKTEAKAAELEEAAAEKRAEYDEAKAKLDEITTEIKSCDAQIKAVVKERERAAKLLADVQLEAKKLQTKIGRFNKDQASAKKLVDDMMHKHPWIESEQKYFGQPNTDYDFGGALDRDDDESEDEEEEEGKEEAGGRRQRGGARKRGRTAASSSSSGNGKDPVMAAKELKALQREQDALAKKINKKVMNMLDKAENEYQDLMKKRNVIEADKEKIEKVISELDVKKNQALQTTWVKVNRDFGSIFSTLLPGTSAKLEPPEGAESVLGGLEVKVAFGAVWKESLTELSGGQRSLLALSLILALLLFKPAPMYILDEVDAALDLSHTQNIGAMLRTHFSNSQFIVVSLKEGMFNNANVIFRTKFVDGSSTVTRTTNGTMANGAENEADEAIHRRKRGKGVESSQRRRQAGATIA